MTSNQNVSEKSLARWLLEEENPSVRYFTLRDLLDRREDDTELQAAKAAIQTSKLITKIFSKQKSEGYWEEPVNPYHPKYKSSYWQIMTLGQLGMDRSDERVRNACEYVFWFQLDEGGFVKAFLNLSNFCNIPEQFKSYPVSTSITYGCPILSCRGT